VTESLQALNLMNLYLAQFRRGYGYTAVYLLRDRTDEAGNQTFGFFRPDYSPRKAAVYLHNLTSILADPGTRTDPGELDFTIPDQPPSVHTLLLQRSDGLFQLVVWGERLEGSDPVRLDLGVKSAEVTIYDPTVGVEPLRRLHADGPLELTMSDHPLVLAVTALQP
jgi:hypothetical protein